MLKKTFISSIIFLSATSSIFAKPTSYVGGGLSMGGYQHTWQKTTAKVFAGKGTLLGAEEKFYIGGEVGAGVSQNQTYGLNASLIPGVMLTKSTMLYSRVGIATQHYRKDFLQFGAQVGVGVQTKLTKKWDIRTEYTTLFTSPTNRSGDVGVGLVYKLD